MYQRSNLRKLNKDEVVRLAPSVLTIDPHNSLSGKYSPISTIDIMDIFEGDGWYPVKAEEVNARGENTKGFQKHLVRFQNDGLKIGDENIEAVLTNSHDGKSSYKFLLGVYRMVCSNGLVVGDTFDQLCLRHMGLDQEAVINASRKMLSFAPKLAEDMGVMKSITLSQNEKRILADSARMIMFPKVEDKEDLPISETALLMARRYEDRSRDDLWTTFNVIQENMLKGKITSYNKKERKYHTTRKVKSIDKNLSLNRALWNLTEEMKKIKQAV